MNCGYNFSTQLRGGGRPPWASIAEQEREFPLNLYFAIPTCTLGHRSNSFRLVVCAVACCLMSVGHSISSAATVTVPLNFQPGDSNQGPYLSAAFDYGAIFSNIETVSLSFTLEQGFDGDIVTTGNITYSRLLGLMLLEDAAPPETVAFSGGPLGRLLLDVPENQMFSNRFFGPGSTLVLETGELIPGEWPEFLYNGSGHVVMADIRWSQTHPLPDNIITSELIAWSAPAGLANATLTITGRSIPEPGGLLLAGALLGLWSAGKIACRRRVG